MNKPTDFSYSLSNFFVQYLAGQKNVSINTIKSYRDTMSLLLKFFMERCNQLPDRITLSKVDSENINGFLAWLETERKNSISTRNQRLAAIHAFFRYVQMEHPDLMLHCQKILAIPFKRHEKTMVQYLSEDSLKSLLEQPNCHTSGGRRDATLLSLLYDTGARVQELVDLVVSDVRLESPATIRLLGKGRKTRHIPLMPQTVNLLIGYIEECNLNHPTKQAYPLFTNRQEQKLSRAGVAYILNKYAQMANNELSLSEKSISPHVLRHTKAMHLLKANVNIFYIRDFLGHVDVVTTEVYARADTEMKRAALEKANKDLIPLTTPVWQKDKDLLSWLQNLGQDKN